MRQYANSPKHPPVAGFGKLAFKVGELVACCLLSG